MCLRTTGEEFDPESHFISRKTRFSCTETNVTADARIRINGANQFGLKALTVKSATGDQDKSLGCSTEHSVAEGSL